MVMMLSSCISGIMLLTGGGEESNIDIDQVEMCVTNAIALVKKDTMSYEDFTSWARSNRDVMSVMDSLNKLASAAKDDIASEDSADDIHEHGNIIFLPIIFILNLNLLNVSRFDKQNKTKSFL
jgi:hypothetical protein